MNGKLFQSFAGVVKQHAMVNGNPVPANTPFLAMGIFVPNAASEPKLLVMMHGGALGTVNLMDVQIELTDDMKKALAEVVLAS